MNINNLVRQNIKSLKPYVSARLSHLEGILLDANENGLGPVVDSFPELELNRYPDPSHNELRKELGSYLGIPINNLYVGVGSDEIIDLLFRIFCEPKSDSVIIMEPTYGMYRVAAELNDVNVIQVPLNPDFRIDHEKLDKSFNEKVKLIFICNPNNPTANFIEPGEIIKIVENYKAICVVDEAYIEFTQKESMIYEAARLHNLVVLRTFSKVWGLAGIRCGYCSASAEIVNLLYKIKLPYNLNKITSAVVMDALKNSNKKEKMLKEILLQRELLIESLKAINGIRKVYPSDTNFILFEVDEPKMIYVELIKEDIVVRDRSDQIEHCLRVTVGSEQENLKFINAINKLIG